MNLLNVSTKIFCREDVKNLGINSRMSFLFMRFEAWLRFGRSEETLRKARNIGDWHLPVR
jgi:hypothetical protein